jgi:hypothetical protein
MKKRTIKPFFRAVALVACIGTAAVLFTSLSSASAASALRAVDQNDPVAVASQYIRLMNLLEFEKVKEIATEESHELLDLFALLLADAEDVEDTPFTILRSQVDGDQAFVFYIDENTLEGEDVVELRRVNGEWLIHISKENIIDEDFDFGID